MLLLAWPFTGITGCADIFNSNLSHVHKENTKVWSLNVLCGEDLLLHVCVNVPSAFLKYISTCQSVYLHLSAHQKCDYLSSIVNSQASIMAVDHLLLQIKVCTLTEICITVWLTSLLLLSSLHMENILTLKNI